jgi:hypothetical protein
VDFIQREATHAFIDGESLEVKKHLSMSRDRSLNEAFNQALKLQVAKTAARPPATSNENPHGNAAATSRALQEWATEMLAV